MAILVPYDGSHPAQNAVEHAVKTTGDEEIILLRVIEVASGSIEAGINLVQEKLKEKQEEEADELSEEIETILDTDRVEFRVETAVGKPSREIVSFAEEHDITQIIIGSHGREGVSRVLLGNVAENVVRRAPTTVTVVR
ncbi:universal stress protein [Halorarum salinum]|uniref:Universal stress protein n=1 Tax=Halorarum salinum TaxID=2743089 RepID=A0A7D5LBV1_9EURY|nr:universal stress protein [Halobaculum salinum]QLG63186.1 universal stress protein [Halobaculum salinum]